MKKSISSLCLLLMTGCGAIKHGAPELVTPNLDRLAPRWMTSHQDPARPGGLETPDQKDSQELNEAIVSTSENRIAFKKVIPAGEEGRERFLAWKNDALGAEIRSGTFSHRRMDTRNRLRGELDRTPLSYDGELKLWFIPLKKLMDGKVTDWDPTDLHLLDVQLELLDAGVVRFEVQFRAAGPLPKLTMNLSGVEINDAPTLGGLPPEAGIVLLRERIWNPSSRNLKMALKPALIDGARIEGDAMYAAYFGIPHLAHSYATLDTVELTLTRAEGTQVLQAEEIGEIAIGPHEELQLVWRAKSHKRKICPESPPPLPMVRYVLAAELFGRLYVQRTLSDLSGDRTQDLSWAHDLHRKLLGVPAPGSIYTRESCEGFFAP